jgi:hypothetical protein
MVLWMITQKMARSIIGARLLTNAAENHLKFCAGAWDMEAAGYYDALGRQITLTVPPEKSLHVVVSDPEEPLRPALLSELERTALEEFAHGYQDTVLKPIRPGSRASAATMLTSLLLIEATARVALYAAIDEEERNGELPLYDRTRLPSVIPALSSHTGNWETLEALLSNLRARGAHMRADPGLSIMSSGLHDRAMTGAAMRQQEADPRSLTNRPEALEEMLIAFVTQDDAVFYFLRAATMIMGRSTEDDATLERLVFSGDPTPFRIAFADYEKLTRLPGSTQSYGTRAGYERFVTAVAATIAGRTHDDLIDLAIAFPKGIPVLALRKTGAPAP